MYTFETSVRVRYAETDQMGYVYYGNYAMYYEVARVESFRNLGFAYKELEEQGVMMPVLEHYSKFLKPGRYDERLTIKVRIPEMPGVRIRFEYEIFNEKDEHIQTGWTLLVFINMENGRPVKAPTHMVELLKPYFDEE